MKRIGQWGPDGAAYAKLGDALFVPAVKADLAGQLMVRRGIGDQRIQMADPAQKPSFLDMPWDDAINEFRARGIVKPNELSTLMGDYAQRADVARKLMLENIQKEVRAQLEKSLREGGTYQQFASALDEKKVSLGIADTDSSYLQCFPAETPVTGAVVTAAFRRWYEGPMLEVVTSNGRKFSATPNHPMLTRAGWRTAGELCEGDDLVCYARKQSPVVLGQDDVEAPPPSIAEVFDAATLAGGLKRMDGTALDFHGDGSECDVDVVRAARCLTIGRFAALHKPLGDLLFPKSHNTTAPEFCSVCGSLLMVTQECGFCVCSPSDASTAQALADSAVTSAEMVCDRLGALARVVSANDLVDRQVVTGSLTARLAASLEEQPPRILAASPDASGGDSVVDGSNTSPELLGDYAEAEARDIEFDRVISVRVREFAGHVYNLSTTHGYYAVDDIVTGNCVFRTNIQSAYGAGRFKAMKDPVVQAARPYVQYRTVGDARVRPEHAVLDGTVYDASGGVWERVCPPNSYNCRCSAVMLTPEEAAGKEVLGQVPAAYVPDPDFDGPPVARLPASLPSNDNASPPQVQVPEQLQPTLPPEVSNQIAEQAQQSLTPEQKAVTQGIDDSELNYLRGGMRDLETHRSAYEGATPEEVANIAAGITPTKNGQPFEPIKIESGSSDPRYQYILVDGRHRLQAAREAGAPYILAEVDGKRLLVPIPSIKSA